MTYLFAGELAVVTAVLTIGVLNLALGFLLAVALERPLVRGWAGTRFRARRRTRKKETVDHPAEPKIEPVPIRNDTAPQPVSAAVPSVSEAAPVAPAKPRAKSMPWDGLPDAWIERLRADNVAPQTFTEAALWYIYRCVSGCRTPLIDHLDRLVRSKEPLPSVEETLQAVMSCREQLSQWSLVLRNKPADADAKFGDELRQLLDQHQAQIETMVAAQQQDMQHGSPLPAMLQRLRQLVQSATALRDQIEQLVCRMLVNNKRLSQIPSEFHLDEATLTFNPLGLARLAEDWIQNDPSRVRLVCGVVVDVDRCAEINDQIGEKAGDNLLASLGTGLKSLIRKERGFDRIARLSGQRFILFFGDTSLRNATTGAERIRSNVAATSFKVHNQTIQLNVSCGVTEWASNQSFDAWLQETQQILKEAKERGRNCTCVAEADGSCTVATSNYAIPAREVVVE